MNIYTKQYQKNFRIVGSDAPEWVTSFLFGSEVHAQIAAKLVKWFYRIGQELTREYFLLTLASKKITPVEVPLENNSIEHIKKYYRIVDQKVPDWLRDYHFFTYEGCELVLNLYRQCLLSGNEMKYYDMARLLDTLEDFDIMIPCVPF